MKRFVFRKDVVIVLALAVSRLSFPSEIDLALKLSKWSKPGEEINWIERLPEESAVKIKCGELDDRGASLNTLIHKTRSNLVSNLRLKPLPEKKSAILSTIDFRLQESCDELHRTLQDTFKNQDIAKSEMLFILDKIESSLVAENIDLFE